nr:hypothetical protein [Nonomuraea aridisoli]
MAKQAVQVQDAVGDLVGAAGEDHAAGAEGRGAVGARRGGAAQFGQAVGHHLVLVLQVGGVRLCGGVGDEAGHGDRDAGLVGGVADLGPGVAVGVPVLRPVLGGAAEDAEEHRQSEFDGAVDRMVKMRSRWRGMADRTRLLDGPGARCVRRFSRAWPRRAVAARTAFTGLRTAFQTEASVEEAIQVVQAAPENPPGPS